MVPICVTKGNPSATVSEITAVKQLGVRARPFIVSYLIALLILVLLLLATAGVPDNAVMLETGWDYVWTRADIDEVRGLDAGAWEPVGFPSNPDGRNGQTEVWFRRIMPDLDYHSVHLFVFSIDLAAAFYSADGTLLYAHNFPPSGPLFAGWPWHAFSLEGVSAGEPLFVRVVSDYRDIGLWGEIFAAEPWSIMRTLVSRDLPYLGVAAVAGGILLFATATLSAATDRRRTIMLMLLLLSLIVSVVASTYSRSFLIPQGRFWYLAETNAYLVFVVLSLLFIRSLVRPPFRAIILAFGIWTAVLLSVINLLFALSAYPLTLAVLVIDGTYLGGLALFLLLAVLRRLLSKDHSFLIFNFLIMGGLFTLDVLVSYGVLPWMHSVLPLVLFQFAAGVIYLYVQRFEIVQVQLKTITGEMEARVRKLEGEKESYRSRAEEDPLTGLANRRAVHDELLRLAADRRGDGFSVILLDIDSFKSINDEHGHAAGDDVLRTLAGLLRSAVRASETVGRYGGDEFMIVLPGADLADAWEVAERIRVRCDTNTWSVPSAVTISAGVATFAGETTDDLVARADERLYVAKRAGRNRVETG